MASKAAQNLPTVTVVKDKLTRVINESDLEAWKKDGWSKKVEKKVEAPASDEK